MTEYATKSASELPCWLCVVLGALIVALVTSSANAQTSVTDGRTPLGMAAGAPAGSYSLSDLDQVNLFSGNLSFAIPLISIGGRGSAGYTMMLRPNENKFKWRVIHTTQRTCGQYGCTITGHTYFPSINWWATIESQPGYRPGVLVGRKSGENPTQPGGCPNGTSVWSSTLTRITFSTGDGTEYELRDQLLTGQPQPLPGGTCGGQAGLRGKVWLTADGTALTFISDVDIYDHSSNPETFYPSGYILFRDGTRYRIDNGSVSWIRDRNGNQVTLSSGTITDSLKRTVTYSYGEPDVITFKGFSGATRTIQVSHTTLSAALRPCRPDPGYQCFSIQTYKQLFPASDGSSVTQFNPSVVSAATLPDGRQYRFYYNSYAELARVDLPTGGVVEYDYAAGAGADSTGLTDAWVGSFIEKAIYRRVVERRIYADGLNLEGRTTYSIDTNPTIVDHLKPTGELISREKHYFHGDPRTTFFLGNNSYGTWNDGREYKTQIFSNDGTTELRRVENNWQQGCTVSPWATLIPNNPRIADTTSTLEPSTANQVSKEVFNYDCYNNLTDKYEYDFGTGVPAANYTRRTHTDYLTISPVNGASYDTLNPSSSNPDINASYHLRNLPSQVSLYDAAGVERQRTSFEYDNYVVDTNHSALTPRSSISGLCTVIASPTSCDNSNPTSYAKRGNVTAVTGTLLVNGSPTGSISTYSQYDIAGNVVKMIDGRGNATTLFYDDVFGAPNGNARLNTPPVELAGAVSYALATKITNAIGHSVYTKYDYYLGKATDGEDPNGVVASGYFNDPLDRPTQVRRAVGTPIENQSTFVYDDANRVITTLSDRDGNNDNLLVRKVLYDQMGRTTETRRYEGGINYIVTQTQYDALGRPFKTSSPFRPWQSESAAWTTQMFDALGRVISVNTPDTAVVNTSYSGNTVTVTDQAGKVRKSVTDAFGRLTNIYEDPSGVNYQTTYAYDVLNNLVKVMQGGQDRFFMYDSLKRLIRVRNPEQVTYGPLNLSDPMTGNSAWSIGYQYDANGNLTQRTDARGTVSTYAYDALNRNTTIDYSETLSISPDVSRFYDGATNGKGRLWYSYAGGSESAGSNVEKTLFDSYDALGRPTMLRQLFKQNGVWSSAYQISRAYNLAGAVTLQVYPSGHSVTYYYDNAGRLADKDAQNLAFTGNLGDGVLRTYSRGVSYTSAGQLKQEQFGTTTPVYNKLFYNSRQQLAEIIASTTGGDSSWNRGKIINGYSLQCSGAGCNATDNNGNLRKQEIYIPANDQVSSYTSWYQQYDYDTLNRLQRAHEYTGNPALDWQQEYVYDRWGNRTISAAGTWIGNPNNAPDPRLNEMVFDTTDLASTNRLYAPGDLALPENQRRMRYDASGNLTADTYTGAGERVYDAESRITKAWGGDNQWQYYTYNADGQRTRRKIDNEETWQVYGIDGELLVEYPANAAAASPQKEYGYRNGQLLVTAEPAAGGGNMNGYTYRRSITIDHAKVPNSDQTNFPVLVSGTYSYLATEGNGGSVRNANGYDVIFTSDSGCATKLDHEVERYNATTGGVSYWVKVPLVSHASDTVIYMCYGNSGITTDQSNRTGVWNSNFKAVYHLNDNAANTTVADSTSNGSNGTNAANTSSKTTSGQIGQGMNYNGTTDLTSTGVTPAKSFTWECWFKLTDWTIQPGSSNYSTLMATVYSTSADWALLMLWKDPGYGVQFASDNAGGITTGNGSVAPGSWHHIAYSRTGDNGSYALYLDGVLKGTVSGGVANVTSTITLGLRPEHTSQALNGVLDEVRVSNTARSADWLKAEYNNQSAPATFYSISAASGGSSANVLWLITDHLGTPRMVFDQTGSLAGVKRHDYLPFGEELMAQHGLRSTSLGYSGGDSIRQKFTQKERDVETGLDYFGARYYSSNQGRFTSPDPLSFWMLVRKKQDLYIANPQRWNKYAYVLNNPLRYVDPDGLAEIPTWDKLNKELRDDLAKRLGKDAQKIWNGWSNDQRQHVLNVRAVLMDKGVWKDVREIAYGRVDVKDEWGARNTVTFTPDNSQSSWQLGILSDKNMEWVLKEAGFEGESANWNHEEGRYTMKQPGDDVVLHMVLLDKPADAFSVPHFDSGGGSIVNREHFKEWWSGKGLTHDKITTALGRTSAGQYLRGISDSMDKLLVQPKR